MFDIVTIREAAEAAVRPAQKFKSETLGPPGTIVTIYMRELTSRESDDWGLSVMTFEADPEQAGKMKTTMDTDKAAGQRARLVCKCLCDEKGGPLLDDKRHPLRESEVESWPNRVITELHGFATDLNALDEEAVEQMGKGLEEAAVPDSSQD